MRIGVDYDVVYLPTRPELTIANLGSVARGHCYSETRYEIVSRQALSADDIVRLDACQLFGLGQGYHRESTESFTENAPPVAVCRKTGRPLPDVVPAAYNGEPITNTYPYTYHRYIIVRSLDSGD